VQKIVNKKPFPVRTAFCFPNYDAKKRVGTLAGKYGKPEIALLGSRLTI
jgi:hypothetical protein